MRQPSPARAAWRPVEIRYLDVEAARVPPTSVLTLQALGMMRRAVAAPALGERPAEHRYPRRNPR